MRRNVPFAPSNSNLKSLRHENAFHSRKNHGAGVRFGRLGIKTLNIGWVMKREHQLEIWQHAEALAPIARTALKAIFMQPSSLSLNE